MTTPIVATPGSVIMTRDQLLSLLESQANALEYLFTMRESQIQAWKDDYPARLAEYMKFVDNRVNIEFQSEYHAHRYQRPVNRSFVDFILGRKTEPEEPVNENESLMDYAWRKLGITNQEEFVKYALERFSYWCETWTSSNPWERLLQVETKYVEQFITNGYEDIIKKLANRTRAVARAEGATFVLTEADFKTINGHIEKAKHPLEPVKMEYYPSYEDWDY